MLFHKRPRAYIGLFWEYLHTPTPFIAMGSFGVAYLSILGIDFIAILQIGGISLVLTV